MVHEFVVDDKPVASCITFDLVNKPHLPVVSVAVGSSIFYFKDFSPYLKLDLPMIEFSENESQVWGELIKLTNSHFNQHEDATESSQEIDLQAMPNLLQKLFTMREEEMCGISYMSSRLLALESQQEQFSFINANMAFLKQVNVINGSRFVHRNFITCMHKVPKNVDGENTQQILLVGTENSQLLILDKTGMAIDKVIPLDSVPVFV